MKKMFTAIMSVIITAACIPVCNAHGMAIAPGYVDKESLVEPFIEKGFTIIDDHGLYQLMAEKTDYSNTEFAICKTGENGVSEIYHVDLTGAVLEAEFPCIGDAEEFCNAVSSGINEFHKQNDRCIYCNVQDVTKSEDGVCRARFVFRNFNRLKMTAEDCSAELADALTRQGAAAVQITLAQKLYNLNWTADGVQMFSVPEEKQAEFTAFLAERDLEVRYTDIGAEFIYAQMKTMPVDEQYALAVEIAEKLGVFPYFLYLETTGSEEMTSNEIGEILFDSAPEFAVYKAAKAAVKPYVSAQADTNAALDKTLTASDFGFPEDWEIFCAEGEYVLDKADSPPVSLKPIHEYRIYIPDSALASYNDFLALKGMDSALKELTEQDSDLIGCRGLDSLLSLTGEEQEVLFVPEWKGDANGDGKLNLNDAVAVLQNIALPEKYHLAPQERYNADCDGSDGISGGDALWIQQKNAGLI